MKHVLFIKYLVCLSVFNGVFAYGILKKIFDKNIIKNSAVQYSKNIIKKWQEKNYAKKEYPIHHNDLCINSIKDMPLFYDEHSNAFSFYKTNNSGLFLKNKQGIYAPVIGNLKKIIEPQPQKIEITGRHVFQLYRDESRVGDAFNEYTFASFKDSTIGDILRYHATYEENIKYRISMNSDNSLVVIASLFNVFLCTTKPFQVINVLAGSVARLYFEQVMMDEKGCKIAVLSKTDKANDTKYDVLEFTLNEKE